MASGGRPSPSNDIQQPSKGNPEQCGLSTVLPPPPDPTSFPLILNLQPHPLILNLLKDGNGGGKGRMGWNGGGPSFNKFRMSGMRAVTASPPSFPRKRESRTVCLRMVLSAGNRWIPAQAGRTVERRQEGRLRRPGIMVTGGGYSVRPAVVVYSYGNAAAASGGPPEIYGGFL